VHNCAVLYFVWGQYGECVGEGFDDLKPSWPWLRLGGFLFVEAEYGTRTVVYGKLGHQILAAISADCTNCRTFF
jgi:hypothetical protein